MQEVASGGVESVNGGVSRDMSPKAKSSMPGSAAGVGSPTSGAKEPVPTINEQLAQQ